MLADGMNGLDMAKAVWSPHRQQDWRGRRMESWQGIGYTSVLRRAGAEVTRAGYDGANGGDGIVERWALDGGDHPGGPDMQAHS